MSNKDKFLTNNSIKDGIKREPAGSAEPMNAVAGKWFSGISAQQLERLSDIKDKVIETADKAVTDLVRAKMRIGGLLNEARDMFPGDKEFGQWRKHNIPEISTTEATYCMRVEKQFGNAPALIERVGWSAMRELSYAPEKLVNKIMADPDSAPTTKKDAREAVKEAKEPEPKADEGQELLDELHEQYKEQQEPIEAEYEEVDTPSAPPAEVKDNRVQVQPMTIEEKWRYMLTLNTAKRVKLREHYSRDPFVILGLAPDSELAFISIDTVNAIVKELITDPDLSPLDRDAITQAGTEVREIAIERRKQVEKDGLKAKFEAQVLGGA